MGALRASREWHLLNKQHNGTSLFVSVWWQGCLSTWTFLALFVSIIYANTPPRTGCTGEKGGQVQPGLAAFSSHEFCWNTLPPSQDLSQKLCQLLCVTGSPLRPPPATFCHSANCLWLGGNSGHTAPPVLKATFSVFLLPKDLRSVNGNDRILHRHVSHHQPHHCPDYLSTPLL